MSKNKATVGPLKRKGEGYTVEKKTIKKYSNAAKVTTRSAAFYDNITKGNPYRSSKSLPDNAAKGKATHGSASA